MLSFYLLRVSMIISILKLASVEAAIAGIPCTSRGANNPPDCVERIFPCGTKHYSGYPVIVSGTDTSCSTNPNSFRRGDQYLVQFNAGKGGQCYEIVMHNGECWGKNPINGGDYNCQGRCGPGCGGSDCSNWAKDCLKHDVCSWYFGASGGSADANCGDEYNQAQNDWSTFCLFGINRSCELLNPSQSSNCCSVVSANYPDQGTC